VYYTVIKHDGHLGTRERCGGHEPQASVFYMSLVFSNVRSSQMCGVLKCPKCNVLPPLIMTREEVNKEP